MPIDDEYATITWDTNNPSQGDADRNDLASGLSHGDPALEDVYGRESVSYSGNHNHTLEDGGDSNGHNSNSSSNANHNEGVQDSFVNGGQSSDYHNNILNNKSHNSHPTSSGIIDDGIFITTSVTDPQKEQEGSQNAYVSYLIKTRSNHSEFKTGTFYVRRRFSDFRFLYSRLGSEYLACAIPPLPERLRMEYIKGDRFGPDFTMKRANSLDRFLKRIAAHPILKKAKVFAVFLESPEWNSYMKTRSNSFKGVLDGIQDTLMSAFAKVSVQNPEFLDIKTRADKMDENLSRIDKTFSRVATRKSNLSIDFDDFAAQFGLLAHLEPALAPEFAHFGRGLRQLAEGHTKLKDYLETEYLVSVRDAENYVHSLKALLKQRDQKQIDHEALIEYLNKALSDRDALQAGGGGSNFLRSKVEDIRGLDHEQVKRDRLVRTKAKIVDLTREAQDAKATSEAFDEQTIREVAVFERIRADELKGSLGELADHHIGFYKSLIDDWEGLIDKLEEGVVKDDLVPI
ncbi:hypothetical protein NADFUDRAFT_24834 [Nadsonia fulvescens var. elongata DSM 6958]|uniref:Sorting nexin-4 n=1 Tax=Nadsonia fulvescens var. elongata DSM 6958 TaxID=857566 RepID=A0A1E3PKH8_9ASCO|nr:hypothetical protein NADFUDRAFT_24834 [Nadsonia fulvescens var. elongata DSM 6958]